MNHTLIKNLVSIEEVNTILTEMYDHNLILEGGKDLSIYNVHTRRYHSLCSKPDLKSTWSIAEKLIPLMESLSGNKCTPSRTYTRIYKENSVLNLHKDRETLDLTFSVCIKKDVDWDLCISNLAYNKDSPKPRSYFKNNYTRYNAEVGDGIYCRGKVYPHWRGYYNGVQDQENMYTFLHYQYT